MKSYINKLDKISHEDCRKVAMKSISLSWRKTDNGYFEINSQSFIKNIFILLDRIFRGGEIK